MSLVVLVTNLRSFMEQFSALGRWVEDIQETSEGAAAVRGGPRFLAPLRALSFTPCCPSSHLHWMPASRRRRSAPTLPSISLSPTCSVPFRSTSAARTGRLPPSAPLPALQARG